MARFAWFAILLLVACGSPEADTPPVDSASMAAVQSRPVEEDPHAGFAAEAKASTNRLQLDLKQELAAAMQQSGAADAVEVCSERAAVLTREVSERTGLDVRRVSLQNRNPANQATAGEASVLALMALRPDLADTMIVRDGAPLYMRAIRINTDLCLQCHGAKEDLAPEVLSRLNELYTDDRATGFAEGDLRGAFVVRPLP